MLKTLNTWKEEILGLAILLAAIALAVGGYVGEHVAFAMMALSALVALGPKYFRGVRVTRQGVTIGGDDGDTA